MTLSELQWGLRSPVMPLKTVNKKARHLYYRGDKPPPSFKEFSMSVTETPWAASPTPVRKLDMNTRYLLVVQSKRGVDPIQFYELTRPLTEDEYLTYAGAGQMEGKDILAVTTREFKGKKLYLRIEHTAATDNPNIVLVFDGRGNGRFKTDITSE